MRTLFRPGPNGAIQLASVGAPPVLPASSSPEAVHVSAVASRPTLRATPAARTTVALRTAQARIDALRLRVEAEPGSGQTSALNKVEQHILHGRLPQAGDAMLEIEAALNVRAEAVRVSERLGETVALNTARGEEQEGHGTGEVRVLSRDGMLWLKSKKRLTGAPLLAAEKYRATWSIVHGDEMRTSAYAEAGGAVRTDAFSLSQRKVEAIKALNDVHTQALLRDASLIRLVEAVCGRGDTLVELAQGDKHVAVRLEAELIVACRLLAKHFNIG